MVKCLSSEHIDFFLTLWLTETVGIYVSLGKRSNRGQTKSRTGQFSRIVLKWSTCWRDWTKIKGRLEIWSSFLNSNKSIWFSWRHSCSWWHVAGKHSRGRVQSCQRTANRHTNDDWIRMHVAVRYLGLWFEHGLRRPSIISRTIYFIGQSCPRDDR